MHFLEATSAIIPHAGHDDAERVGAGQFGHRTEEDVDGGFVPVDQRAVGHVDDVLRAVALEHHVSTASSACVPPVEVPMAIT